MPDRRRDFGTRVRAVRERAGYKKPAQLAIAARISTRMVNAVELGEHAGPKTLRAIARTLGWRELDVLDYVAEKAEDLPEPADLPPAPSGDLGPLEEVLEADLDVLKTLARMYAWYMARQESRAATMADQERFMLWALQVRADHARQGDIEPRGSENRDVS